MFSLTRKTDYALVALSYLGARRRDDQGPISAREIADRFELPVSLLMNILKELGGAGLLASTRGANGGYELAVDPAGLSLLDVVTAIEGPIRLATCCATIAEGDADGGPARAPAEEPCSIEQRCPIRKPIHRLHDRIHRFLAEVTLADLLHEPTAAAEPCTCGGPDQKESAQRPAGWAGDEPLDTASLAAMPVLGAATTADCCKGRHEPCP